MLKIEFTDTMVIYNNVCNKETEYLLSVSIFLAGLKTNFQRLACYRCKIISLNKVN